MPPRPSLFARARWAAGGMVLATALAITGFSIHQAVAADPVLYGEAYVLQGRFGDDPAIHTLALAGIDGGGQLNFASAPRVVRRPLVSAAGSDAGPGWDVGFVSGGDFQPDAPDSDAMAGCESVSSSVICAAFSFFAAMGLVPTVDEELDNGIGVWGAWFAVVGSIAEVQAGVPVNGLLGLIDRFCFFSTDELPEECMDEPFVNVPESEMAAPVVLELDRPFDGGVFRGTITLNVQTKYAQRGGSAGAGGRIIAIRVDNLRYEKGSKAWHLFSGSVFSADSFMGAGRGPTIEFYPEKLMPDGRWLPYDGEWHSGIVRVRVVCTPGDFPIKADSTPVRFWFEQEGVFRVQPGNVPGWRCSDRAGNVAASGPAEEIVVRVDRRAPQCTVTPSPASFSRDRAVQVVDVTVNPGSAPAPAVRTWLVSVTGGVASDRIGWSTGTADFQGQLKGGGRKTYTLTYAVEDAAGNVGTCSALVKVT